MAAKKRVLRTIGITFLIIFIVGFCVVGFMVLKMGGFDTDIPIGDHLIGSNYSIDIAPKYFPLDTALNKAKIKKENFMFDHRENNYYLYFCRDGYSVYEYEFLIKDDLYYYVGNTTTNYYAPELSSNYGEEATMRSYLQVPLSKSYLRLFELDKRFGALPAWGISTDRDIKATTVEGQKIDKVIYLNGEKKAYFWMIYNLQTRKPASEVTIQK